MVGTGGPAIKALSVEELARQPLVEELARPPLVEELARPPLVEELALASVTRPKPAKILRETSSACSILNRIGVDWRPLGRQEIVVAQLIPQQHPILGAVAAAREALTAVRQVQPVFMTPADQEATMVALAGLEAILTELKLRVLPAAGDAACRSGARDVGAWMAWLTHTDLAPARAEARLAEALDRRWTRIAAGMAHGAVSLAQARVIADALDALPEDLDPAIVDQAEEHLVGLCAAWSPAHLRRLGRRILDVVAPEIADAEEAKRLEEEEQRARETCRLTLRPTGQGSTRLSGLLPDADAARLRTYLEAFTSPRKHEDAISGDEDRIPYRRKLGHAFCALLEHLDPAELPAHGGDATTVMVTITLAALQEQLATAGIIDADLTAGANLTATQARRLACTAHLIPAVLGGKGEILDLGRSRRLFTPAQRKAMRLRDQRCRAEGCSIPATWAEAHHLRPWAQGGRTDLDDGVLLCSWHHHRIHDHRYQADKLPTGDLRFHRRT